MDTVNKVMDLVLGGIDWLAKLATSAGLSGEDLFTIFCLIVIGTMLAGLVKIYSK